MFSLHPQLAQDTFFVGDFPLSTCRLMNDMQFPWLILIPRVPGVSELYELSQADQEQFLRESSWLSSQLARVFRADKMNVAALGNMVPQLHIHHVVRYQNDVPDRCHCHFGGFGGRASGLGLVLAGSGRSTLYRDQQ